MSKCRVLCWLVLLTLFCLLRPFPTQAQSPEFLTVNHVAATPGEDSLGLDVFFTITDGNGRPLRDVNIESATIQLIGSANDPVPAAVSDPQTPIYITLLIDGSGSMQNTIGSVRQAAQAAIDSAPPNAFFAVIQFNETLTVIEDFTNDHTRVKAALSLVESVPNQGTCLYDAVYDAIGRLDQRIQTGQERRAIILFTDGRDQLVVGDDTPCSRFTYNDVIGVARPLDLAAPLTPIHTIGLFDNSQNNLNEAELRGLATETDAYSAIGSETNLGALFQEIMDGLNSQWLAQAGVFAAAGENQGVLTVNVRGSGEDVPLSTTFRFISDRNYDLPPAPIGVQVNSLQYDNGGNFYTLSMGVAGTEAMDRLVVNVWDTRRGTQVTADQIFDSPTNALVVEIDAAALEAGREYSIRVQALGEGGFLIPDAEGETLLVDQEFVYEPTQNPAAEFAIQAVNADYDNGQVLIDVDVTNNAQVSTYEGLIVDDATGAKINEFGPVPFDGGQLLAPLPEAIRDAEAPGSYRVTVYLTTADGQRTEAVFDEFSPVPPPPPSFFARLAAGMSANPVIPASIAVIFLSVVGFLVYQNQQKRKAAVPLPRPPVDKTQVFQSPIKQPKAGAAGGWEAEQDPFYEETVAAADMSGPSLTLTITKTPSMPPNREFLLTIFPAIIGRENAEVTIADDRRISRQHAKITFENGQFYVVDLNSGNGTFVNGRRLAANEPAPIDDTTTLRLGSQTELAVDVRLG